MIKQAAKKAFLKMLSFSSHNNLYEFHHVTDQPTLELSPRKMNTDRFYDFVCKHGPYVSVSQIIHQSEFNQTAAITFDDGLEDLYTVAFPFLAEKGIPFTAFVLSEKLDQAGYITRAQMLEMAKNPLVTIGSHGMNHVRLAECSPAVQQEELKRSKDTLEAIIGRPCAYFAYPFGSYSKETLRLIQEAGYEKGFAVKGRALTPANLKIAYEIPRLSVSDSTVQYYDCF